MNIDFYLETIIKENLYSTKKKLNFHMKTLFNNVELKNKNVLDIGGGSGFYSFYAACSGAKQVTCIEPEAEGSASGSIKKFNRLLKLLKCDNISIIPTTFQNFNPNEELYDVILLNNSINHLDEYSCINLKKDLSSKNNYQKIFSKLYSIGNSKSKIIITDCSRYNFFGLLNIKNPFCPTIEWEKHQTPETWAKLLVKEGFKNPVIKWTTHNSLGNLGKFILGNKIAAYFLRSHFNLTVDK